MRIFDFKIKKYRVSCYSWRNPTRMNGYVPQVRFSKTIQGWFKTRGFSFVWSYFSFCIDFTVTNFLDDPQSVAHFKSVSRFGKKIELS